MVKLDMLVNGEPVDAFSSIVHQGPSGGAGTPAGGQIEGSDSAAAICRWPFRRRSAGKLLRARTFRALRKNVTAKCYGGDITRKRKLLEKQKEGKKRMKSIGKINIPQEAFIEVLKAQ